METCCSPLDFLHHPSSLPSVKRDSYSKFGIILTIIFLLLYAVFEVFKIKIIQVIIQLVIPKISKKQIPK